MQFPEMNYTEVIRVPADDSTVPLEVRSTNDDKSFEIHSKQIYISFNSKYQPTDSDFKIPSNCQPMDKDHIPPQFLQLFNRHVHKQKTMKRSIILKMKMAFGN